MLLSLIEATLCQTPLDHRRGVDALKMWMRESSYVLPGFSKVKSRCK